MFNLYNQTTIQKNNYTKLNGTVVIITITVTIAINYIL